MAVTEESLAEYLRLPPDCAESAGIYLAAAKSKARTDGIPDYKNNAQYDLYITALAAMYYDNRGMSGDEKAQAMINGFVLELRHAGEDPDE